MKEEGEEDREEKRREEKRREEKRREEKRREEKRREEKRRESFEECARVGTVVNFVVVVCHFSSGDICREGREV